MRDVSVMIKPASSNCNLRCRYCFYVDIASKRDQFSYGYMDISVLERIISSVLDAADESANFVFQGGEPTLAGLEFYKKVVSLEEKYNYKRLNISNSIQTNGTLLNDEWAGFLAENQFLVGISIDGTKEQHDRLRVDKIGNGTYQKTLEATQLLSNYGVPYNIVTVVTKFIAKKISRIYKEYKKQGWNYFQFIPCLDDYCAVRAKSAYSLTPEMYAHFLKELFDLWINDLIAGQYTYIRYFDNIAGILAGIAPESCSLLGGCRTQLVTEANGSVYPCDFYAIDSYKIGNFMTDSIVEMLESENSTRFCTSCIPLPDKCIKCHWFSLCKGGCRRHRDNSGVLGLNYFCSSYIDFFEYASSRFEILRKLYSQGYYKSYYK